jgi:hypothetical protein
MALSTAQRNRLPRSAFVYAPKGSPRSSWRYPVPTRAQARAAGISERTRAATHRAALSYSARRTTMGTPGRVRSVVARRHAGAVASVGRSRGARGTARSRSR